jgi:glycosyltransferase involved in cell wall biosynthesis/LmbE family N-acetylglucosaminyl deacetylase
MPAVSVVIPTCNRPNLLRRAIDSVFTQSFQDWEVIVVDDRPSEETRAVARSFSERVTYLLGESAGPSRARNRGFQAATGELISFLDDDDVMLPDNLEALSRHLIAHDDTGCAYGWYAWIKSGGTITGRPGPQVKGAAPVVLPGGFEVQPCGTRLQGDIFARLLLEESLLLGSSLIRRSWLDRCRGFDPSIDYQEHWDLYLRLAQAGCRFFCCERMVSLHRLHQSSRSQIHDNRGQNFERMLAGRIRVLDRFLKAENLPPELAAVRKQAYYNAYREFFRPLLLQQRLPEWTAAFAGALTFAPSGSRSYDALGSDLAAVLLSIEDADPIATIDELRGRLRRISGVRRACRRASAQIHLAHAASAHDGAASRPRVLGYLVKAAVADFRPAVLRKVGSLAVEQFITPGLKDWMKFSRRPLPGRLDDVLGRGEVLFLSPHFDDVVLSCGGLLAASPKDRTWLVTVFTSAGDWRLSSLTENLHRQWGTNADAYSQRQAEDTAVTTRLGIHALWLGFLEVIYRDSGLVALNQLFSRTLPAADMPVVDAVRERLLQLVKSFSRCTVFAPLGLGYHRDHLVVHEAARAVERIVGADARFFYYEDFPYSATDEAVRRRLREMGTVLRPTGVDIGATLEQRIELTRLYRSQIGSLFGDETKAGQALTRQALSRGVRGRPRERFWHDMSVERTVPSDAALGGTGATGSPVAG